MEVNLDRETSLSLYLIQGIQHDKWIDKDTIIVNCSPEYSSRLVQIMAHKLCKDDILSVINMEVPKMGMNQVWDVVTDEVRPYDNYVYDWINKFVYPSYKYLFVSNCIYSGKHLNKAKLLLKRKLDLDNFKFATLYVHQDSALKPDYYMREFSNDNPKFFWQ